jgi:DNA-binding protein WhiA
MEYLSENNCFMSFSQRSGRFIVYTKDSSLIEDLLVLMGAGTSSLEIMNAKIYKDIRNKVNRVTNFENANIDKMVKSAEADCEAINYLLEHIDPKDLSDELMAAATLRIENPDMSLSELCEVARPKVSRSGLYHRIKKLSTMAEEIKKREEG